MNEKSQCCLAAVLDEDKRLRVHLVPMPSGDNPWRTQGDYRKEQKRDTLRFYITIASVLIATVSVCATMLIAISTITSSSS